MSGQCSISHLPVKWWPDVRSQIQYITTSVYYANSLKENIYFYLDAYLCLIVKIINTMLYS